MHKLGVIGVTFNKADRNDKGEKVGIWELGGFYFRFMMVDLALQKFRIVVTQPSGDGFAAPTRDATFRLNGDRPQLLEIFGLTSYMRTNREAIADMVEIFVRTEFFNTDRSLAQTAANPAN